MVLFQRARDHHVEAASVFQFQAMKTITPLLLAAVLTTGASAETHDVHFGTVEVPDEFVFKRTGTIDSFMGTLTRKTDGFTITFDVGSMSGMYMHESHKRNWTYVRKHRIGGWPASTGLEALADGRRIATTVGDLKSKQEPANFWADIRKESDIADLLLIVTTYKPKTDAR